MLSLDRKNSEPDPEPKPQDLDLSSQLFLVRNLRGRMKSENAASVNAAAALAVTCFVNWNCANRIKVNNSNYARAVAEAQMKRELFDSITSEAVMALIHKFHWRTKEFSALGRQTFPPLRNKNFGTSMCHVSRSK